jgi:hypothetical protein
MDDDNQESSTVDTDQQDSGEARDDETAGETPTVDLPEDPEALKVFAQQQAQQLIEERRAKRKAIRNAERIAETEREQRAKAEYNAGQLKILEQDRAIKRSGDTQREDAPDDDFSALRGSDVVDFTDTQDTPEEQREGALRLAKALRERGGFVTKRDLERIIREKEQQIASKSARYRVVGELYPDMNVKDSPLQVAAFDEFDRIKQDQPNLDEGTAMELAASRAAARIGYVRPSTNGKDKGKDTNADRLRTAQGPTGKNEPAGAFVPVKLTEGQIRESMRISGLPREEAMKLAQRSENALAKARHEQKQHART